MKMGVCSGAVLTCFVAFIGEVKRGLHHMMKKNARLFYSEGFRI